MTLSLGNAGRFLQYIWQNFNKDNCTQSAAALTYMSLFAVVPLMTVVYTVFSSIPSFQNLGGNLQSMIFDHFIPSSGMEVQEYLLRFSEQARKLTWIGIAFLATTAFLMLKHIETAFNAIWGIEHNRQGLNGFLLYWAILSLGPLLLGAGFAVSTYLLSLSVFFNGVDPLGIGQSLLRLFPLSMTTITFTLMFYAIPNCKVPFKHALSGGLITAICFELAKLLFASLIRHSSYQIVYGAFAAIPLLLLWMYLSWLLLLSGAELVYALSHYTKASTRRNNDPLILLELLAFVSVRHQSGDTVSETELRKWQCYDGQLLAPAHWEKLRKISLQHKLLQRTENGHYILGRDLHKLPLWEFIEAVPQPAELPLIEQDGPQWMTVFQDLLRQHQQQSRKTLAISVGKLLEDPPPGGQS